MNQMSVATFDTLAAVRNLEKAGVGTSQAEAITETIRVAVFQGVATKEDLAEQREAQKAEIAELRTELKAEIAELRTELKAEIAELRAATEQVRGELKADIAELRAGQRADIAELHTALEKLRADLTWRMVLAVGTLLAIFAALDRFVLN